MDTKITHNDLPLPGHPLGKLWQNAFELAQHHWSHPESVLHGQPHWLAVARHGLTLLQNGSGGDPVCVLLFALFHDILRNSDGRDPDHGPRAGQLVTEHGKAMGLNTKQSETLAYACAHHTRGQISNDCTVGTCWDADRLDLWRIDLPPRNIYMSTDAGKSGHIIQSAQHERENHNMDWSSLLAGYHSCIG